MYSFCAMYSLRMSVWTVPRSSVARDALLVADADVEREQHRRRRVDRHRRRDLAERDAGEQRLHVLERVDRDALAADLAERARVVRVVAHQRRHVERGREPGLAVLEQVAEALVRLLGRAEAGELAHRPEPAAVHRRVDAARERVLPRIAEIALVVDPDVLRRVQRLDRKPGDRRGRARVSRLALRGRHRLRHCAPYPGDRPSTPRDGAERRARRLGSVPEEVPRLRSRKRERGHADLDADQLAPGVAWSSREEHELKREDADRARARTAPGRARGSGRCRRSRARRAPSPARAARATAPRRRTSRRRSA